MTVVSKYIESFQREGSGEVDPAFGIRRWDLDGQWSSVQPRNGVPCHFSAPPLQYRRGKMPATYEIDKQRRLVITTASGRITLAEALAHQEKLRKDPDFDPSFSQIMDLSRVTEFALEANDIRRLAQGTIFSGESRRAIIASSDLVYGFGRMFEILREIAGENGIRVFRNLDAALDWIFSKNLTA